MKGVELFWLHFFLVWTCGAVLDSFFLDENSSTFKGGAKIVPWVELSYAPWNGSRGGAILAPLFSVCLPLYIILLP